MRIGVVCAAGMLAALLCLVSPLDAAGSYQGDLDPCPEDNSTREAMVGTGSVAATLAGDMLTIEGRFAGFASPATAAHLNQGAAMGVPGPAITALGVTHAASGQVSGQVKLTRAQLDALGKGALYVQLDSEKAPGGNSWAWLETGSP